MTVDEKNEKLHKLLANYRLWGILATGSFAIFVFLSAAVIYRGLVHPLMPFMVLLSGLLWVGTTTLSRHSYMLIKKHLGMEVGIMEFLSTQFVSFVFFFSYRKLRKDIEAFRKKAAGG